ncbi:hypothetical protein OROGR_010660 [Orobanche gracilis]
MSDEEEKAGSNAISQPEQEESARLKTAAERKYSSGNLISALKYAKRAHKLHPSLEGLPEMITAFRILRDAAEDAPPCLESTSEIQNPIPDYYKILQVERFSHHSTIKKQYKKLALALHPDKSTFTASEEAFKLVGEASRVLSDKIRRKEYDTRLRISMQSKAAEEVGLAAEMAVETFWTACSACRLLHQFEKKYMGHNLVCPRCKKSFKAVEVKEHTTNDVGVEKSLIRVSSRIRERIAKCGSLGIVEKCGLRVKRKSSSVDEVFERSEMRMSRNNGGNDVLLKDLKSKRVKKLVNGEENMDNNELRTIRDGGKRAKSREEDTMTLSQMKILVKKEKKQIEGNLMMKEKEDNGENSKANKKGRKNEKEEEKMKMVDLTLKTYKRRVRKDRDMAIINITSKSPLHSEIEHNMSSRKDNLETEKENRDGNENEKEMSDKREKRERRRVSKYGNWEEVKREKSKNHEKSDIERLIAKKKGILEIMPVEDSDFHDFDKDRKGRSFKKGQVWAVYDDDDGMPRHYALIDQIVSVNPFEVTLSWLLFQNNGDEDVISLHKMGFYVSCGSFRVSKNTSIKYLNLFSHVVNCERASREVYRIYPMKGSVWAIYRNNALEAEKEDKSVGTDRCYDIVLCLSSYSDIHGLSVGYLEKLPGFRTVFKRKEIGVNAVLILGTNDVKLFSHQIPAKKLSDEEALRLPKDCWELDPASLTPQLLIGT